MSKLVIKNLPENKELDRQALAEFKGGNDALRLLAQIGHERVDFASAAAPLDQEPELGLSQQLRSLGVLQNQPFTPHSIRG